jgi:hypothetical protein
MIASLETKRFRLSVIIGQSEGALESSRRILDEIIDGDMNPRKFSPGANSGREFRIAVA